MKKFYRYIPYEGKIILHRFPIKEFETINSSNSWNDYFYEDTSFNVFSKHIFLNFRNEDKDKGVYMFMNLFKFKEQQ